MMTSTSQAEQQQHQQVIETQQHASQSQSIVQADDATTQQPSSPPRRPCLLREWSHPPPPVAPAVVLNECCSPDSPSRQPKQYSYPVATFVSTLLRNAVDHVYAASVVDAESVVAGGNNNSDQDAALPLSVRSEADAQALRSIAFGVDTTTTSLRSLAATTSNDNAGEIEEFVLVDGDLVAVPAPPPNEAEIEALEQHVKDKNCRAPRMRRGVRGIRKWFKKRHAKLKRQAARCQPLEEQQTAAAPLESSSLSTRSLPAAPESESVPAAAGASTPRKTKKKKRLSWRRTDPEEVLEFQDEVPGIPAMAAIPECVSSSSRGSVASVAAEASFIGNADQLLEAGVLSQDVAVAYIEPDDKKEDTVAASVVPPDADFKVDKADAPSVDAMLRRAAYENDTDLDDRGSDSTTGYPSKPEGKTKGESCPLSNATADDDEVHNDILKVVMVGAPNVDKSALARALRQSTKRHKKPTSMRVDVHSLTTSNDAGQQVKFSIWDVQGACREDGDPNFGAHPGTQSLFFSSKTLYLLVWDLAATNPKTYRHGLDADEDEEDDEDDYENEYLREKAHREADRALQADIEERVLAWIDCIARRGPDSAVVPIAVIPEFMKDEEAKRRCSLMQMLLMHHLHRFQGDTTAPKLIMGDENIMCVNLALGMGVDQLRETLLAIATDVRQAVFDHVLAPVSNTTMQVLDAVRRLKQDHKLVLLDHLLVELDPKIDREEVKAALNLLTSVGELFYFGTDHDEVLSRYVILSRKWLVSAVSCVLRNNLKQELVETRRFMNMQCIYSDQEFAENDVTQALLEGGSNCPLVSSSDTRMLWQSTSFMRQAADRSADTTEEPTIAATIFDYLERLLVQTGVFLPLHMNSGVDSEDVYFIPSLVVPANRGDVWTYKSSESWMTTLCHSWLFRDGAPADLMEHLTVSLLRDLYEFSRGFGGGGVDREPVHRVSTYPMTNSSLHEFMTSHSGDSLGRIRIHQLMSWKSSLLIKIGCVFTDPETDELRESFVEVFVDICDQSSSHCVASDVMRPSMQRIIVSGKGQVGHHGSKLWKGGYSIVLDSIKASLANFSNVDRQVVCPECLAHAHPSTASTWSWDSVLAAAHSGSSVVRCMRGHAVDSHLICGAIKRTESVNPQPALQDSISSPGAVPVPELLGAVLLVGLWDSRRNVIRNVGSGFIVDKKLGLVVTAGHVLFNMDEGRSFGMPYFGIPQARAVIGVIPDGGQTAVFRYFAEIVADDINSVDACVLRITTRMENDVGGEGEGCALQPEFLLDSSAMNREKLPSLKLARRGIELEETARVLGFNQGGEGLLVQGKHVNRIVDYARGYVCKKFKADLSSSTPNPGQSGFMSKLGFTPREEIVVMCPTISGHSGGPCVNDEGKVIGILSRADPVDRQRCYLVPASELKTLVNRAKKQGKQPFKILG